MAGNIVKWWKHKILGGYKQFSVQECTTDSEELVQQQIRASSSCSAPPDLLLVSEREHCLSQRPVASTSEANLNGNYAQRQHHQSHIQNHNNTQQLNTTNSTKEATTTSTSKHSKNDSVSTKCKTSKLIDIDTATEDNNENVAANIIGEQALMPEQSDCLGYDKEREDQLRFEEFTCDVSVEGGKSSKPLQFSFTFYDLDGHHGKITKDDIVGIVYTIYESIGKSVVVPHYGSKTINVRLTFSPESKSRATTAATMNNNGDVVDGKMGTHVQSNSAPTGKMHGRRQHRYRPRKLIKSEDEEDDSQSDKEKDNNNLCAGASAGHNVHKKLSRHAGKPKLSDKMQQKQQNNDNSISHSFTHSQTHSAPTHTYTNTHTQSINNDSIYDNINLENLKCCAASKDNATNMNTTGLTANTAIILEACTGCGTKLNHDGLSKRHVDKPTTTASASISTRVKVLRKTRKQKQQDHQCTEHRQRSLSVGNEICYKNRQLAQMQQQQQQQQQISKQTQTFDKVEEHTTIDGVQLRHPPKDANNVRCVKRNSAECWKSALNRNDLISIIRESMEKNRLCFQLNEKPQANVTPIRQTQHQRSSLQQQHSQQHSQQRLRSNTVSKIPTLIAHHSNSCLNNINNNNINNVESHTGHEQNHSSNASLCQLQPHIPIYHQQMAINPAVVAAQNNLNGHNKSNPCGYDSFLHATICAGGITPGAGRNSSYSPSATPLPPTTPTLALPTAAALLLQQQQSQQPIATVQPILSVPTAIMPHEAKTANASSTHQIKLSKILRSGAYSQNYQQYHSNIVGSSNQTPCPTANTTQNSPQYRGYQRLASQHNLPPLNLQSSALNDAKSHMEKRAHSRDRCAKSKQSAKNNESLVYAKLREDLQENIFNATGNLGGEHAINKCKDLPYRKHAAYKMARHAKHHNCAKIQQMSEQEQQHNKKPDYISMLAMNGVDAIECENLLDEQTSDEELTSEVTTPNIDSTNQLIIHESEETLPTPTTATNNTLTHNTATANTTSNNSESLINLNDDADCKLEAELTAPEVEADEDEDLEDDADVDVDVDVDDEDEHDNELDIEPTEDDLIANNNNNSHLSPSGSRAALTACNSTAANANNGGNTSATSTSSLIHRCVHEHIHHHYHHFEKKDE